MRSLIVTALGVCLCPLGCFGQRTATAAPAPSLGAVDAYVAYKLPALKDRPDDPSQLGKLSLQVISRAKTLQLDAASATNAWSRASATVATRHGASPGAPRSQKVLRCSTLTQLRQALADTSASVIRVDARDLSLDAPIDVSRHEFTLDLTGVVLYAAPSITWMLRIRDSSAVTISGGTFTSGQSAILVQNSQSVLIEDARFRALNGSGIVITSSSGVRVSGSDFSGLQFAPLILHVATSNSVVESNTFHDNVGTSNLAAGIVITDREVDVATDPHLLLGVDGHFPVVQLMSRRLRPPHDNVILSNSLTDNLSSGIYSDGSVRNVIYGNIIRGNSKEGLCLDYGSTGNVVAANTIAQNGRRWGETDEVLQHEFVAAGGRLADGTAAAKVPGISIDNAIYNIILGNILADNYGGGIKMVRTSYFNTIGLNSLLNNNDGEGPAFHFFGIELGAAPGDAEALDIDFTSSRGNILFSNVVRGNHYSGIYLGNGSDLNDLFNNTVMDAEHWALESTAVMNNSSLDNLTNLPSLNIASGLTLMGLQ